MDGSSGLSASGRRGRETEKGGTIIYHDLTGQDLRGEEEEGREGVRRNEYQGLRLF